jgi:hypothetical protein
LPEIRPHPTRAKRIFRSLTNGLVMNIGLGMSVVG